ncbi:MULTISPECIES: lysophospholipid acyltransferase family protein [Gordonia]|uniref:lysophospholipid acyltransferase family protein n=1 Tax=Gordonia TaxID=2053 RepID=UPI0007EAEDDE|nr:MULTISPECIES: lysophospholipid acyltransferase family protein [Gordonia]OBC11019.1 glycerol acyltransferase [Gordonia sp. 852002-50395_SCH5434458]
MTAAAIISPPTSPASLPTQTVVPTAHPVPAHNPSSSATIRTESHRHAWYPASPCGDLCHADNPFARANALVVATRVVLLAASTIVFLLMGSLVAVLPRLLRRAYIRTSARTLLWSLGVRVVIDDRRPFAASTRGLVVSNHISYLDILAVAVVNPARFVAKCDVMSMPVVSTLARRLGIISIDRGSLRTLPATVDRAVAELQADNSVAVFPEGTTWCGRARGEFRPAFFQAAIDAGVPVIPLHVEFEVSGMVTAAAGFIGDDSPADTLRRVLRTRGLAVRIRVHESQLPGSDRRELAERCAELVGGVPAHAHP